MALLNYNFKINFLGVILRKLNCKILCYQYLKKSRKEVVLFSVRARNVLFVYFLL